MLLLTKNDAVIEPNAVTGHIHMLLHLDLSSSELILISDFYGFMTILGEKAMEERIHKGAGFVRRGILSA
jgi:hypothetical protein